MMAAMFAVPLLLLHGLLGGLKRRERRRQVLRLAVLAYIAPLFAFGPETIHGWFADFSVRRAYAGCVAPSECSIYYRYDHNGNLVAKWLDADGPSGAGAAVLDTRYVWDAAGRLIVVDPTPGQSSPDLGSITYYRYDHEGIRVGRSSGGVDVRFVVDKQQPYAQVVEERRVNADRSTTLLVRYTHGDDLISQERHDTGGAPARYYYHYDGQMSARHLTDETGTLINRHRYDAFGQDIDGRSDAPVTNDYRYTGEQYDAAAGMYYLRARYYAPGQGRFVSRDPFGGRVTDPQTLHKYSYTAASPIDRGDPSGLDFTALGTLKAAAIVGILSGIIIGGVGAGLKGALVGGGVGFVGSVVLAATLLGAGGILAYLMGLTLWKGFTLAGALAFLADVGSKPPWTLEELQSGPSLQDSAFGIIVIVLTLIQLLPFARGAGAGTRGVLYQIDDGVRRAKAAQLQSMPTIRAQVTTRDGSRVIGEFDVAIDALRSPKEYIDVTTVSQQARFLNVMKGTRDGTLPPIQVREGAVGTPLREVGFQRQ